MPGAPQDASLALVEAVEAFLVWTAHRLHDGPVQRLVAARLMLESALGGMPTDPMGAAAMRALGDAVDECRALLWLLEPPTAGTDLAADVGDLARRGGAGAQVRVDGAWDHAATPVLLRCVHALVVDALATGGAVDEVTVVGTPDGGAVVTVAEASGGDGASKLRTRLGAALVNQLAHAAGGTFEVEVDGDRRRNTVRLPAAA